MTQVLRFVVCFAVCAAAATVFSFGRVAPVLAGVVAGVWFLRRTKGPSLRWTWLEMTDGGPNAFVVEVAWSDVVLHPLWTLRMWADADAAFARGLEGVTEFSSDRLREQPKAKAVFSGRRY